MRVLSPDGLWPFAKKRNGTVLAEGAGILMLEELEHAKARGAPILAELLGYGMTADAADMVNPSIDGASTAMQIALDDSGLAPSDIDYINAHGTATAVNDINETRAIKRVFGNAANIPRGVFDGAQKVARYFAARRAQLSPADPDRLRRQPQAVKLPRPAKH